MYYWNTLSNALFYSNCHELWNQYIAFFWTLLIGLKRIILMIVKIDLKLNYCKRFGENFNLIVSEYFYFIVFDAKIKMDFLLNF